MATLPFPSLWFHKRTSDRILESSSDFDVQFQPTIEFYSRLLGEVERMYMAAINFFQKARRDSTTVYNSSTDIKVSKDVGPVS